MYRERTVKKNCAECGCLFDARVRTNNRFHNRPCALAAMRRDLAIAPEVRFWSKVDKSGECWSWTAGCTPNGYGKFPLTARISIGAHRYSYELEHGVGSAKGWFVCHHCDKNYPRGDISYRRCVRPEHLFLGSNSDNILDAVSKGRAAVGDHNGTRIYPERLARGERHYAGKLTDDKVREILRRSDAGESRAALAVEFDVSAVMISRVALRKSWRHVV